MSQRPVMLNQLERWMQSVLMHPGSMEESLASPEANRHLSLQPDELEEVIAPSKAQTGVERLEIYVNAYRMRLLECLRAEFSATCRAMGDELFDAMMFGYLQEHASQSYTLGQFGAHFPAFLAKSTIHVHAAPPGSAPCWGEFVIELARWERLVSEVFDGPGSERAPGLSAAGLKRLHHEDWANVQLIPAPDLRLATFSHPVHRYWRGARSGQPRPTPTRYLTRLAVHRRDFAIVECELSEEQFTLLERITSGAPLQQSVASLLSAEIADVEKSFDQQVFGWFSEWSRRGFFTDAIAMPPT